MTWNFRVVRSTKSLDKHSIHKVHYEEKKPITMNRDVVCLCRDSVDGLAFDVLAIQRAITKPVLTCDDENEAFIETEPAAM